MYQKISSKKQFIHNECTVFTEVTIMLCGLQFEPPQRQRLQQRLTTLMRDCISMNPKTAATLLHES